jgi:hypothetical protein
VHAWPFQPGNAFISPIHFVAIAPVGSVSSPGGRRLTKVTSKVPAKVWLIWEAAAQGNLAQRGIGNQHHMARQLQPASYQVVVRRLPKCPFECAGKVTIASLRDSAEIADQGAGTNIRIDVIAHALSLPSQEAIARLDSLAAWQRTFEFESQQRRCSGNWDLRGLTIFQEVLLCNIQQLYDPANKIA